MSEPEGPKRPNDLDARLKEAQSRRQAEKDRGAARGRAANSGMGLGFRIAVDIVAALIVGVGIGVLLDRWLGTTPWLMIVFFVLGSAAGLMNVFRAVSGQGYSVGFRKDRKNGPDADRK